MNDERASEIVDTLWMFVQADSKSLTRNDGETHLDILVYNYPQFVRRLREAAEFSSYTPNAMKWSAMADDLEKFGRERDRKDA